MDTLYYWVGRTVVWAVCTFLIGAAIYAVWNAEWFGPTKRKLSHAVLLFRVMVLHRPHLISRRVAEIYFMLARRDRSATGRFVWWERMLCAYIVRQSHRVGWKEPDQSQAPTGSAARYG